jgi:putative ABC transport system permease protein
MAGMLGIFAVIALCLACGGVYASMLHMVGLRRHELGVRLALGARSTNLMTLVLRSCLRLAALGIAAGTAGSLAGSRVIGSMVWGVSVTDASGLAAVAAIVLLVALGACIVPAARAARTDPLETIRME